MFKNCVKLYEGKAKIVSYATPSKDILIQHFKDIVTRFNIKDSTPKPGKGMANNVISAYLMTQLNAQKVKTHFISLVNRSDQLVYALDMIPIEVVVRNFTAGSLCRRLLMEANIPISPPIIELSYKLHADDALITEDHVLLLDLLDMQQLNYIKNEARKINGIISNVFADKSIQLVDCKLEFGFKNGEIILGDEISCDTCRLLDMNVENLEDKIMDKDRFRLDLGNLVLKYFEVVKRLDALPLLSDEEQTLLEKECNA